MTWLGAVACGTPDTSDGGARDVGVDAAPSVDAGAHDADRIDASRDAGLDAFDLDAFDLDASDLDAAHSDVGVDAGTPDAGPLACPRAAASGEPNQDYVLDASSFFTGTATATRWTVVSDNPCDQLFVAGGDAPSFALTGATSPMLTLRPRLSGTYTVTLSVDTSDATYTCSFGVPIAGPGLRVELCSDRTASTDVDLHLHRPGTTTSWFTYSLAGAIGSDINLDDCHWATCRAAITGSRAAFGLASSPLASCSGGPDGAAWTTLGECPNPRLEWDGANAASLPENTNVDAPEDGQPYRILVDYAAGTGAVHPLVNVFCGGTRAATFGAAPDVVSGFDTSSPVGTGSMWRVADVRPHVDATGRTTGCDVSAIHPRGSTTGYAITLGNRSY